LPIHNFTTSDIFEYDFNVISKQDNYMQMDLLTGDQYIRIGIMGFSNGVQGYDELGISHIKIEFQENNLHLERTSPSNVTLIDNLPLTNANGTYKLYIGSVFTNPSQIDYDNFVLCTQQTEPLQPTLEDRVSILENQVENLTARVTLLETIVNKIQNYFWFMPQFIKKDILCGSLEKTGQKNITLWNLNCEMKKQKKNDVCGCNKV
jgi:hypothetical protein